MCGYIGIQRLKFFVKEIQNKLHFIPTINKEIKQITIFI
jgi:hypothetical protein